MVDIVLLPYLAGPRAGLEERGAARPGLGRLEHGPHLQPSPGERAPECDPVRMLNQSL